MIEIYTICAVICVFILATNIEEVKQSVYDELINEKDIDLKKVSHETVIDIATWSTVFIASVLWPVTLLLMVFSAGDE